MLPYHNTQIKHQNPGASEPLILPVHLLCNTGDEELHANIRENSRFRKQWLQLQEPHDRVAVVCGSGPSLADGMDQISRWAFGGGGFDVFALNGAASYLYSKGVLADYQIIIDPRPQTAQLVGPAAAHLFASQVHPKCFEAAPGARLWHLQIEGIDALLPPQEEELCLIGGAASVGNTALCLLYAMGYRRLELFGYDSSHRAGKSHAFAQPMNAGEPCAWVEFAGKKYLCSLTMKLQAERFQNTALALRGLGCKIRVHGDGLLPAMYNAPLEMSKQELYERMWLFDDYRAVSPGQELVPGFLATLKPAEGSLVRDFGCGTGRAGLRLKAAGLRVELIDFAGNCRDPEALTLPFRKHDLRQPLGECESALGFCTDVLEHIEEADLPAVLATIKSACTQAMLHVSLIEDVGGDLLGQRLHVTVRPADWWLELLSRCGIEVLWQYTTADSLLCVIQGDQK